MWTTDESHLCSILWFKIWIFIQFSPREVSGAQRPCCKEREKTPSSPIMGYMNLSLLPLRCHQLWECFCCARSGGHVAMVTLKKMVCVNVWATPRGEPTFHFFFFSWGKYGLNESSGREEEEELSKYGRLSAAEGERERGYRSGCEIISNMSPSVEIQFHSS